MSVRILQSASDVDAPVLAAVEDCLCWYGDQSTLDTEEFIDRLCDKFGGDAWDIENYSSPAVMKIMRHARALFYA